MQTRRRIVSVCAACLALTAVVGAGFSAWVFQTDVRKDAGVGVHVTYASTFGEITLPTDNYRLVLDQDDGTAANGITLESGTDTYATATSISATWTVSETEYNATKNEEGTAQIEYYLNIYVKTETLGKYVQVVGMDTATTYSESYSTGYTMYQAELTVEASAITTADNTVTVTLTYTLPTDANLFQYYTADGTDTLKKPDTFELYQAMVATLTGEDAATIEAGTDYNVAASEKLIAFEFEVKNVKE